MSSMDSKSTFFELLSELKRASGNNAVQLVDRLMCIIRSVELTSSERLAATRSITKAKLNTLSGPTPEMQHFYAIEEKSQELYTR